MAESNTGTGSGSGTPDREPKPDPGPGSGRESAGDLTPGSTIGEADGGVSRRVARRCRIAGSMLAAVGGSVLVLAGLRSWDMVSAMSTLLAAAALAGAALLVKRAGLWSSIARSRPTDGGRLATVGALRPLSPGRAGAPIRRRIGAAVVRIASTDGPPPGGGALVVHGRFDGVALVAGDTVRCWRAVRGGLETSAAHDDPAETPDSGGGRFVLRRGSDSAVFLATTRLTDTW